MSLISTIENDLTAAGHTVDGIIHSVLSKHLGLVNLAAHVANDVADVQGTPWAQMAEEFAGLTPALVTTVARYAREIAADLAAASAPAVAAPQPEPEQPAA